MSPHHRSCLRALVLDLALLLTLAANTAAQQAPPASTPPAASLPADRKAGAASVDVPQLKQWLYTLASPEFEGRATGQPGFQKAADYVAAHFKALGLEARGDDGSYFQTVPWTKTTVSAEQSFLAFDKAGVEVLRIPNERLTGTISSGLSTKGDVVLLVVTPKPPPVAAAGQTRGRAMPTFDGLDDLELTDKVVLVYVRAANDEAGAPIDRQQAQLAARRALQGKQAAAVLLVGDEPTHGGLVGRTGAGRRGGNRAIAGRTRSPLDAAFGGDDFATLLAAAGIEPAALQKAALLTPLPLTANLQMTVTEGQAPAMNVFAVLPGSDPKLRDEYVVIGSHLDHLGTRGDTWFPGADDDGSGTTGVMALSRMFANNGVRPARSVLFVCFCGEEAGLIGSNFFSKNCPVPLSSIVTELQMDMIGRDEEEAMDGPMRRVNKGETAAENLNSLHLVGTRRLAPTLHTLCLEANERAGFDLEYDQEDMFTRSDHANFADKGVPVAFFFTGLHRDYHQTTDTPDKIHYEKLLRVADYVYDIAFELANEPTRPEIEAGLWQRFRDDSNGSLPTVPAAPLRKSGG